MGLYRRRNSPKWYVSYTVAGKHYDETTGTADEQTAKDIWKRLDAKITLGTWHPETRTSDGQTITMVELIDKYMTDVSPLRAGSKERDLQIVPHFKRFFGDVLLKDVGTRLVSDYKAMRLKSDSPKGGKLSPDTVRKELGLLRTIFYWAMDEQELVDKNPVRAVIKTLPEQNQRTRVVTPAEALELRKTIPGWLKPIVVVACQTGLRRENLVNLAVAGVDFGQNRITVQKTKSGKPLGIKMTELVKETIQGLLRERKMASPYVFSDGQGKPHSLYKVSVAFKRAAVRAGIPDLRLHDLRHDFATLMLRKTRNLVDVQHACGHADPRMTMRYAHLLPEDLKESFEAIDGEGTAAVISG